MKKGFTLLEILITLGIVGVIAALTLPNMIKNHQKRVLVAQLQRTYNAIMTAVPMYMDEARAITMYDTEAFNYNSSKEDTTPLENFIKENFRTSKICTKDTVGGKEACFGKTYKSLDGSTVNGFADNGMPVCAILKTGATVCFGRMWDKYTFPIMNIDVNGPQGPNVWGRDAFDLEFNNAGDLAESFDTNPEYQHHQAEHCGEWQWAYASGCFNKIIEDGWKMDY